MYTESYESLGFQKADLTSGSIVCNRLFVNDIVRFSGNFYTAVDKPFLRYAEATVNGECMLLPLTLFKAPQPYSEEESRFKGLSTFTDATVRRGTVAAILNHKGADLQVVELFEYTADASLFSADGKPTGEYAPRSYRIPVLDAPLPF